MKATNTGIKKEITAERTAHLYALLSWNDSYTKKQAEEIAYATEYEKLDSLSYAEVSIKTAIEGIKEMFLSDKMDLKENIVWSKIKLESSEETYKKVVKILIKIHDNWVKKYAKKYDRGNQEASENKLYQHLPTALIGIDEVALDLMFLAPFLKEMGLNPGEMNLIANGKFKPSEEIVKAYNSYVEEYKQENNIISEEVLSKHIEHCIRGGYEPLKIVNKEDKNSKEYIDSYNRAKYMKTRIELLTKAVISNNQKAFKSLPKTLLSV